MSVTTTKASVIIRGNESEQIPVDEHGNTPVDLRPDLVINVPLENIHILPKSKLVNGNGMVYASTLHAGKRVKAIIFEEEQSKDVQSHRESMNCETCEHAYLNEGDFPECDESYSIYAGMDGKCK